MILGYVLGGLLSGHFSRTVLRIGLAVVPSVLASELLRERTHFARASTALVVSAALDAGFALWLYANGVPLYPDRFSGVAGPNFSAIFLTVGATIALTRLARSTPAKVLAIPGVLGGLALATLSKMAALGLAIGGLMALPLVTRRNRLVLAAAAIILVAGALSTGTVRDRIRARFEPAMQNDGVRRTSAELRVSMMEAAVRGFGEHPLTGLGYGRFQQYSLTHPEILAATAGRGFGTHNTYLEVLVEGGLLAFVPFVLHFGFLRRALAVYRAAVSSSDTVGAAAVAGLPAMLLCAALINMLLHYSLWAVIGIALAASRIQSASPAIATPRRVAS
jgi:O-antigen ligase